VTNVHYGDCTCKCFKILELTNLKKHWTLFPGICVKLKYLWTVYKMLLCINKMRPTLMILA